MKLDLKETLVDHALELAWSLWSELGVSGWRRHHTSHAIDLEWLILYTAGLGGRDPRLRDEATDWCIRFGRYVASARLRNLLREVNGPVMSGYGAFAATVNVHSIHHLPKAGEQPRNFKPTGRSQPPDLQRASLLALRLRASFGVTARAEILRLYLSDPDGEFAASDLARGAGYSKRNIADALEGLSASGILQALPIKNQIRYRLLRRESLFTLVGEVPEVFPPWSLVVPMVLYFLQLAEDTAKSTDRVRGVEASKLLAGFAPSLQRARIIAPGELGPGMGWAAFEEWALRVSGAWSQGRFDEDRVSRRFNRQGI